MHRRQMRAGFICIFHARFSHFQKKKNSCAICTFCCEDHLQYSEKKYMSCDDERLREFSNMIISTLDFLSAIEVCYFVYETKNNNKDILFDIELLQ